ncbi:MAG: cupin protein [Marmoricola sp.]|nr:cupin protein [Marmoricola sp.]
MTPRTVNDVIPATFPFATDWRLVETSHPEDPVDVATGVAEYPAPSGTEDPESREGHPHTELQFVVSGTGVLRIGDERTPVTAGDAYAIPPGSRHTLWSTTDAPLRCFYVLLVPKAGADATGDRADSGSDQ